VTPGQTKIAAPGLRDSTNRARPTREAQLSLRPGTGHPSVRRKKRLEGSARCVGLSLDPVLSNLGSGTRETTAGGRSG
jgi:hypothetical protein